MKNQTYFNLFETEEAAHRRMVTKNRAARDGSVFCLLEHPEGWAVMDLRSAVETELPYEWSLI